MLRMAHPPKLYRIILCDGPLGQAFVLKPSARETLEFVTERRRSNASEVAVTDADGTPLSEDDLHRLVQAEVRAAKLK